jgi:hypothetical protein
MVFSGTLNPTGTFSLEVSCSVNEQTKAQTKATVSKTEKILALCQLDQLYPDPESGKVEIHASPDPESQDQILNNQKCSCKDDDGNTVLTNFNLKADTKFVFAATVDKSNCDKEICPCTLECYYMTASNEKVSVSRKVKIMKPEIYMRSSFERLTHYKNTSTITAFTYPPSKDISCFANKVSINSFTAQDFNEDESFSDLVLEKLQTNSPNSAVYHVFPNISTALASGVYGIKCTSSSSSASATFLFEFDNSEASSIAGEKVDFEQYVSVPCSCDQTPSFCDYQCCCDPDCSDIQVITMK